MIGAGLVVNRASRKMFLDLTGDPATAALLGRMAAIGAGVMLADLSGVMDAFDEATVQPDFESFARSARPSLVRIVRGVLAPFASDQAEDVVQVALLTVWRHWDELDSPHSYAAKVALRLAVRYAQAHQEHTGIALDGVELPAPETTREIDARPLKVDLDRAIGELPARQRAAILLHLEGKTCLEIAQHLGISPGTAANHLHQARAKLRNLLGDRPGDHHE